MGTVLRSFVLVLVSTSVSIAATDYDRAIAKVDAITNNKAAPGSVIVFSRAEIEAWARIEIPKEVPEGFREPKAELGNGVATGRALLDFSLMRQGKGAKPNLLFDTFLGGERPVSVTLEIKSANGWCTVFLRRVEISSITASGGVLDFLLKTFFLPLYPNAKINEPFELDYRMESITVQPGGIAVKIKGTPPAKKVLPKKRTVRR